MNHIYCGDGKGKTTCAFGLALRAAGRGLRVVIVQFLKNGDSGEREALAHVPGVKLLPVPERMKFTFAMDEGEKKAAAATSAALLDEAARLVAAGECGLLVLDEVCGAISTGLLSSARVTEFLDRKPDGVEVVMTGRDPAQALLQRADYVTEMKKIKHPFDAGVAARRGIEW